MKRALLVAACAVIFSILPAEAVTMSTCSQGPAVCTLADSLFGGPTNWTFLTGSAFDIPVNIGETGYGTIVVNSPPLSYAGDCTTFTAPFTCAYFYGGTAAINDLFSVASIATSTIVTALGNPTGIFPGTYTGINGQNAYFFMTFGNNTCFSSATTPCMGVLYDSTTGQELVADTNLNTGVVYSTTPPGEATEPDTWFLIGAPFVGFALLLKRRQQKDQSPA